MNLRELAARTGENPRQIRHLIAEGFVPPPDGRTRDASYDGRHVEAIAAYRALRSAGFTPASVHRMLASSRPRLDLALAPGVRLTVDPLAAGMGDEAPDPLRVSESVREALASWLAQPVRPPRVADFADSEEKTDAV